MQADHARDEFSEKLSERERLYHDIKKLVDNIMRQMENICNLIMPHVIDIRELDLYMDKCRRFLR